MKKTIELSDSTLEAIENYRKFIISQETIFTKKTLLESDIELIIKLAIVHGECYFEFFNETFKKNQEVTQ